MRLVATILNGADIQHSSHHQNSHTVGQCSCRGGFALVRSSDSLIWLQNPDLALPDLCHRLTPYLPSSTILQACRTSFSSLNTLCSPQQASNILFLPAKIPFLASPISTSMSLPQAAFCDCEALQWAPYSCPTLKVILKKNLLLLKLHLIPCQSRGSVRPRMCHCVYPAYLLPRWTRGWHFVNMCSINKGLICAQP